MRICLMRMMHDEDDAHKNDEDDAKKVLHSSSSSSNSKLSIKYIDKREVSLRGTVISHYLIC